MTAHATSGRAEILGKKAHDCKYNTTSSLLVSYSHMRLKGAEKPKSVPERMAQCLTYDLYNYDRGSG